MASIAVRDYVSALTAQGGTDGFVTVADASGYYAGADGWLQNPADPDNAQHVLITEVVSATNKVGVRFLDLPQNRGGATYTRSDASAFPSGSKLFMGSQVVRVEGVVSMVRPKSELG